MEQEEYNKLRAERNQLRDQYESSTSVLGAARLKKKIMEIDLKLSEYETKNK